MADLKNITFSELLGKNFADKDFAVDTNWRIDFDQSQEFKSLISNNEVLKHMSYACTSDFDFETETTYATASIKGIPISQAAWQSRVIDSMTITILEPMDRSVETALLKAQNSGAGYSGARDIPEKSIYTMDGVRLLELGNDGKLVDVINLLGVQIKGVKLGTFSSSGDSANIVSTELTIYAHGWEKGSEKS